MKKRIIIDGVTGTGRESLQEMLCEEYGLSKGTYITFSKGMSNSFYDKELDLTNIVTVGSFIGDPIYSKLTETDCLLTEEDINLLVNKAKDSKYIIIICLTTEDKRVKGVNKVVDKNINEINSYFKLMIKKHDLMLYDPFNESIVDLLKKLDRKFEEE